MVWRLQGRPPCFQGREGKLLRKLSLFMGWEGWPGYVSFLASLSYTNGSPLICGQSRTPQVLAQMCVQVQLLVCAFYSEESTVGWGSRLLPWGKLSLACFVAAQSCETSCLQLWGVSRKTRVQMRRPLFGLSTRLWPWPENLVLCLSLGTRSAIHGDPTLDCIRLAVLGAFSLWPELLKGSVCSYRPLRTSLTTTAMPTQVITCI